MDEMPRIGPGGVSVALGDAKDGMSRIVLRHRKTTSGIPYY
jgi:hypothetical protein